MPVVKDNEFAFGGLNTRASSTGLPLLDLTQLQDMRVVGTDLVERLGIVRVNQLTGNQAGMTFTGASSMSCSNAIDSRVWALGLYWTVEFAFQATSGAGTQGLVCAGSTTPAMIFDITGGNIRARVWDSSGTSTTITVGSASANLVTVQLTRSGATLSARMDNGTATTGSMSASLAVRTPVGDLRIARDDSTNYFDGTFDYLRTYSIARSSHADRLVRMPAARAPFVLADYDLKKSAASLVYDRSRYANHLICNNTPVSATSLCHNPAPIRGLSMGVDTSTNRKQLLALAGGSYYVAAVD